MTTFIFTGKSSDLNADYNPPIYLEEDTNYEIALVNFDSFYSIPNIDSANNTLLWWDAYNQVQISEIPEGSYEIDNLGDAIQKSISRKDPSTIILIDLDQVTSRVVIRSNRKISFEVKNSIGSVLGFTNQTIEPNIRTSGNSPVSIIKVNAICIDCNIAGGSYMNGRPVHVIHSFFPTVSPGYKIVEAPAQPIYHPVTVKTITNIRVRIIDQDGQLLNFKDDIRTIRVHLRKVENGSKV
jgi:hypothetical protein